MWRLFLRIKCRFSALYNFIQNFQKKSVILVLICIKRYLKTHFEFNSEKVGFKKKKNNNNFLFSILHYVFVRLFWRHQCRQRSGFPDLEGEVNLHSNVQ